MTVTAIPAPRCRVKPLAAHAYTMPVVRELFASRRDLREVASAAADLRPQPNDARTAPSDSPERGEDGAAPSASPRTPRRHEREVVALVYAARDRDEAAWAQLVARFNPMLRRIGHSYRLSPGDVDDVAQATWLRAFANIHRIREPAAIPGWLAATARREALRRLQTSTRECLSDDPWTFERSAEDDPESEALAADRRAVLQRAMATLPKRHRALMMLIASQDKPDYRTISSALGMPIGSIGPIRGRCLARLQHHEELRELCA